MQTQRLAMFIQIALALFVPALILALHPFTPNPAADIKLLLTACMAGLGLLAGAWMLLRSRPENLVWPPLASILLVWTGWLFVAAWASAYPDNSLMSAGRFLALTAIFLVAALCYRSPRHFRYLALIACTGVALASLYGLLQKIGWDPFPWDEGHRRTAEYAKLPSTFGNPNLAGHVLILAMILNGYLVAQRGWWRWTVVFFPFFLLHFYFTGLRSGFVALGAALLLLVLMMLLRRFKLTSVRATLLCLGSFAAIGVGLLLSGMLFWRWHSGHWLPLDSSLLLRYNALLSGARMWLEQPWLGWGPGNYAIENPPFWTPYEQLWYATEGRVNRNVHNDLIEHAIHSGILGAFFYVAFFVGGIGLGLQAWFKATSRELRLLGGLIACLFLAFVVDGQFGFNLHAPVSAALFILLAGAGLGVLRRNLGEASCRDQKALLVLPVRLLLALMMFGSAIYLVYWEQRVFQGRLSQQSGRGAIEWEAYDAAESLLSKAEAAIPWSWEIPHDLGNAAFEAGEVDEAARHYGRARTRHPHDMRNLLALGRLYLGQGIVARQQEQFVEESLDVEEMIPEGETADSYLAQASELATTLVRLCPPWSEANLLMAQCILTAAEYPLDGSVAGIENEEQAEAVASARHYLEQALLEAPTGYRAQLLGMHARICMAQDDYEAAGASLIRAVQANPGNDATLLLFWEYSQHQDRIPEMLAELASHQPRLERNLRVDGMPWDEANLGWNLLYQAKSLEALAQIDEAAAKFQEAGQYIAYDVGFWSEYTDFALAHDALDAYEATLMRAVGDLATRDINIPAGVEALAIYWDQGMRGLSSATNRLFVSIQEDHAHLPPSQRAARFAWCIRMLEASLEALSQDLKTASWLRARFGAFYHGIGEYETAFAEFEAHVGALPADQQLILGFFWYESAKALEQHERALEIARYMQGLAPGSWEWHLAEARALVTLDRREAAVLVYNRVAQEAVLDTEERASLQEEMAALDE